MTCYTAGTPFEQAIKLLIENGFNGVADTIGIMMNAAMKIELARFLQAEPYERTGQRQGYANGYLRKSIASQPFSARVNTGDNTPAMIHTEIVPGDKLKISIMPKGGGSENCSRLTVLPPARGRQGVIDFVVNLVDESGSNPCPPVIVGLGIGGTTDQTMFIAKKALLRKVGEPNPDPEVAELEKEILRRINNLGIGAMGYGGTITALAVHAEVFPCHIASMPVAVNMQCWCSRHEEAIL